MTDQEAYGHARSRAKSKLDFYSHVLAYVVVNAFLFAVNWVTSPEYYWAAWPLVGWGVGLVLHGLIVFLRTSDPMILERMTERELEKERNRNG